MEGIVYRSTAFAFSIGEGLLLYSDGITEAENAVEDFFGRDHLLTELERLAAWDAAPRAVVDGLFASVTAFADGAPQADDITALGLRFG